ncbi:MAG: hypothetical protein ACPHJ3_16405, partial [Rubripirellula sp.]
DIVFVGLEVFLPTARQPPASSAKPLGRSLPEVAGTDLTEKEYRSDLPFGLLYKASTARFSQQRRKSSLQALAMQSSCMIHQTSSKQ